MEQYSTKLPLQVSAELRERALRIEHEIGEGRDEGQFMIGADDPLN